jgi:hypothetical protein
MQFLTINTQDNLNELAAELVMREREILQYDKNIARYTAILAVLPDTEWPAHLTQYKGKTLDLVPDEYDEEVDALNKRDRIKSLLKTEREQRGMSSLAYQAIREDIKDVDADELRAAIQAALVAIQG